jgi:hypothetical protein
MSPRTGELIAGRYRLDRLLEARGDGQRLYVADDLVLSRKVELRMPEGSAPDPVGDDRLRREGRLLARASGPGVVRVLDAIEQEGRPLVVTEHVDGATLAEITRASAPLPAAVAVAHTLALLDALIGVRERLPSGQVPVHRTVIIHADGVTVTGLRERAADPAQRDPGVPAVCETLYELLTSRRPDDPDETGRPGAPSGEIPDSLVSGIPPHVQLALRQGLDGTITTLTDLRAALSPDDVRVTRNALPGQVAMGVLSLVLAFVAILGLVTQCGGGDGPSSLPSGEPGRTVPVTGVVTVPDLDGLAEADARTRVEDAGLEPFVTRSGTEGVERGRVAAQTPPPGEETPAGSRVVITVSSGPVPVRVPDVRGLSLDDARDDIRESGLLIRGLRFRPAPERPGTVLGTVPAPGAGVEPGTEIVVVVSR